MSKSVICSPLVGSAANSPKRGWPIHLTKEELSKLLAALYDAAAAPSLWPVFLQALGGATESSPSAILMHDLNNGEHGISLQSGVDASALFAYGEYFGSRDVWLQKSAPFIKEGWLAVSDDICSFQQLSRTDFYNDYLKPNHMAHAMWGVLEKSPSRIINVGLYRDLGRPFEQKDLELLRFLAPHIIRAFRLHLQLSELKTRSENLQHAFDTLATGMILLGDQGRIIHVNRKAAKFLANKDGLQVLHGFLQAARTQESNELQHLIREAQATSTGTGLGPGGAVRITRELEQPLLVLVIPVRNISFDSAVSVHSIVFITDPSENARPAAEILRALFELTPAESRIALLLCDGYAPPEIANLLHVSVNTLKTQMRSIYRKTRTSRQSQLLRLLGNITLVQSQK